MFLFCCNIFSWLKSIHSILGQVTTYSHSISVFFLYLPSTWFYCFLLLALDLLPDNQVPCSRKNWCFFFLISGSFVNASLYPLHIHKCVFQYPWCPYGQSSNSKVTCSPSFERLYSMTSLLWIDLPKFLDFTTVNVVTTIVRQVVVWQPFLHIGAFLFFSLLIIVTSFVVFESGYIVWLFSLFGFFKNCQRRIR